MTKSKRKQRKKASQSVGVSKEDINIDSLFAEAETAIDSFNYEDAAEKLKKIIEVDSSHIKALEMLAGIQIEQDNWVEAQTLFKKCIDLSPDVGYSKYFSMGQMHDGEESLAYYQKGVQIIEKELENSENVSPSQESSKKILVRTLSEAFCSISEIFMTDCCFVEGAEEKCFQAIETAIKTDSSNSEAHQCLANFYLVKEQVEEAKAAMQKSLDLWLPLHEGIRDGNTESSALNESEVIIPSYDSRIQTSKLLIELEMFDEASNILDGLVEEDEDVVEVWYLQGWMNYIQGDDYKLNAHYYLNRAKEVSEKTGMTEADYIKHIHELIDELKPLFPLNEPDDVKELGSDIESNSDEEMET